MAASYPATTWDKNVQDTGNDWAGANPDQYSNAADHNEMADEVEAVENDLRNFVYMTRPAAYKTADETVNNSNALQDDDHLTFDMGASEEWAFEIWGFYSTAAAADIKVSMNADQAATKIIAQVWLNGAYQDNIAAYEGTVALDAGALTAAPLHIIGTIENAGAGATVVLRWCQDTADVSDTKILQGSFLRAWRLS